MSKNKLYSFIIEIVGWARAYGRVSMLCRFSLLSLIVGAFFLFIPQGQEVLWLMDADNRHWLNAPLFVIAGVLWALGSWYWARAILSFQFPDWPPSPLTPGDDLPHKCRIAAKVAPRALGTLALAAISLALLVAIGPRPLTFVFVGLTLLFLAFVVYRRDVFKRFFTDETSWAFSDNKGNASVRELRNKQPWTARLLVLSLLGTSALFALFACRYTNLLAAPIFGSAAILLFAAAAWVPAGSVLIYLSHRYRFPALSFVMIYVIAISGCTDNHRIAHIDLGPGQQPAAPNPPANLEEDFRQWLAQKQHPDGRPVPVYLVAAEGGGIRAAYWTASVLGKLQEMNPAFAAHTYAISGVSGGSLGAAMFDALLASNPQQTPLQYANCAQNILSEDFLAPAIASMLYPEIVQRFVPYPIDYFDRGRTLEAAWEKAWNRTAARFPNRTCARNAPDDIFGKSFDKLWQGDDKRMIPALLLNATQVETGHRVIMSNLPVAADDFANADSLRDKWEGKDLIKRPINMPLSTAVHGSARFTYVSPAGKLNHDFHIVDGGYFENSGNSSLNEVLRVLNKYRDKIQPIVIHISNDPILEKIYLEKSISSQGGALKLGSPASSGLKIGKEVLPPVVALLNTRDARGIFATATIAHEVTSNYCNGLFFHFGLNGKLPLGWSLSSKAEEEIQKQLDAPEMGKLMDSVLKALERPASAKDCRNG